MKIKLFLFFILSAVVLSTYLSSCTPNNPQPNPPPNPTNSNWKFKLTINGNTNHAEGSGYNQSSNYCIAAGGTGPSFTVFEVDMKLNDPTAASYISGELGFGYVASSYTVLGVQNIYNCWIGSFPWITNVLPEVALAAAAGYALTLNGTMVPNSASPGSVLRLPINITDLGSPGNNDMITFGNPVKGNYSGTIYVRSGLTPGYDTPVTIDLDFVALRP